MSRVSQDIEIIGVETNNKIPNSAKRIPVIVDMEEQGKNYTEIAEVLGVDRRTIYRDRQDPLYPALQDELIPLYREKIKEFVDSGDRQKEIEGVKEIGRADRARITRRSEVKQELTLTQHQIIEQRRTARLVLDSLDPNTQREIIESFNKIKQIDKDS